MHESAQLALNFLKSVIKKKKKKLKRSCLIYTYFNKKFMFLFTKTNSEGDHKSIILSYLYILLYGIFYTIYIY